MWGGTFDNWAPESSVGICVLGTGPSTQCLYYLLSEDSNSGWHRSRQGEGRRKGDNCTGSAEVSVGTGTRCEQLKRSMNILCDRNLGASIWLGYRVGL